MFAPPREPSRARSGLHFNEITPQGEVTLNAGVNTNLYAKRKAIEGKFPNNPELRMGSVNNSDQISIFPTELVFTFKGTGKQAFHGESSVSVFSAFNGTPTFGLNQADYEARFQFIGIAKTAYDFDDERQMHNGVSVRTRGSGTTVNTGRKEIMAGDSMVWRIVSVIPAEREKERKQLPRIQGIPGDKYLAITEPLDLRDVHRLG